MRVGLRSVLLNGSRMEHLRRQGLSPSQAMNLPPPVRAYLRKQRPELALVSSPVLGTREAQPFATCDDWWHSTEGTRRTGPSAPPGSYLPAVEVSKSTTTRTLGRANVSSSRPNF